MSFKPNPKEQVKLKFEELFGKDYQPTIVGRRLTMADFRKSKSHCTLSSGLYLTEVILDGHVIASAVDRDWRGSYRTLAREVEKLFADGVALV